MWRRKLVVTYLEYLARYRTGLYPSWCRSSVCDAQFAMCCNDVINSRYDPNKDAPFHSLALCSVLAD